MGILDRGTSSLLSALGCSCFIEPDRQCKWKGRCKIWVLTAIEPMAVPDSPSKRGPVCPSLASGWGTENFGPPLLPADPQKNQGKRAKTRCGSLPGELASRADSTHRKMHGRGPWPVSGWHHGIACRAKRLADCAPRCLHRSIAMVASEVPSRVPKT